MKRASGKEETFLDVPVVLGRNLEICGQSLRNELPRPSVSLSVSAVPEQR